MVVMFHTGVITSDTPLLSMLRMPFYFMLSGLFFKDYGGFKTIVKKINKLIVPFLFFYTVSYIIYIGVSQAASADISLSYFSFVYSKEIVNVALWFLLALFWANVSFLIIYKISKNLYMLGILSIFISAIGIYIFSNSDNQLPLFIDSGLCVLPFFYLGYLLKSTDILYPNRLDRYAPLIIIGLLLVASGCFLLGNNPNIGFGSVSITGNPYLFFLGAASMVVAFILICKKTGVVMGIRYIGRYSLIILGVHITITSVISLSAKQFNISIPPLLLFIPTIALSILMIPILTKLFPKFTAQKDLISTDILDHVKKTKAVLPD